MNESKHLIIHQNLHKIILKLSIPGMIGSVLQTLYQLIDAYWVGKLGPEALAAIGGSSFILWAIFSLTALSVNGIATLVAQFIGSGKPQKGRIAAGQGMIISTVGAVLFSMLVYFFQDNLFAVMGFDALVLPMAHRYMSIVLTGLIFIFWFTALEAIFRGLGDTKTPMIVLAIALLLNAILDPLLIFGWFGFPAFGVGGAALATVAAQAFASLLCAFFLRRTEFLPALRINNRFRLDKSIMLMILKIGAPIALGGFFFSIIYIILTNIISRFGTEAIAAIGVCHRIEGIAWFACVGFSVAASTLVGQNIGARRYDQAERSAWWVNGYGVFTLLIVSIIFYFFPQWLIGLFTNDPLVEKFGVQYLKIIAIFEIFLALEVIMEGAFSGAGYTFPVMLVSVLFTAARVPLAWFMVIYLGWGANGIWWAISITTFLKGLINALLFIFGLWKRKLGQI